MNLVTQSPKEESLYTQINRLGKNLKKHIDVHKKVHDHRSIFFSR